MRSMTRTLCGLGLMLAVSVAGAQQPGGSTTTVTRGQSSTTAAKKSALELALEQALKNNADLRVAASKLALTEDELSRARLQVTQKVESAYADVLTARAVVAEMERQLTRVRKLHESRAASNEELSQAEAQLSEKKAKLAAAERELNHLQGKSTPNKSEINRNADSVALGLWSLHLRQAQPLAQPKTEASDRLRQTLQKKANLSCKKATPAEYLALVKKTAGGLNVHANTKGEAWTGAIDADFEDMTIGGMLQYLEDSLPGHQIVVREYGLLIVAKDKVPPGALSLAAFLRVEPTKSEVKPTGTTGTGK